MTEDGARAIERWIIGLECGIIRVANENYRSAFTLEQLLPRVGPISHFFPVITDQCSSWSISTLSALLLLTMVEFESCFMDCEMVLGFRLVISLLRA